MLQDITDFSLKAVDIWYNSNESDLEDFLENCKSVEFNIAYEWGEEIEILVSSSTGWVCDIEIGEVGNFSLKAPNGKEISCILFDSREEFDEQLTAGLKHNKVVKVYKEEIRKFLESAYKLWFTDALTEASLDALLVETSVVTKAEIDFKAPVAIGTAIHLRLDTQLYLVTIVITDHFDMYKRLSGNFQYGLGRLSKEECYLRWFEESRFRF